MAMRGVDFKWYDGFFLSMLATSLVIVAINWNKYNLCQNKPLHIWIVVDYTTVFVFRLLMFVDNGLAAGLALQQRDSRFCGRAVVLSILALLLYPFLWVWTVVGSIWFTNAMTVYCGLVCIACTCIGKWLTRRQAQLSAGNSHFRVWDFDQCVIPCVQILVDMVRVPDWAFEAAGQEMRNMGHNAATYHPGLYLTPAQREAVEALIQELPKFRLKAVPTDCTECPICLEEFYVGNEVRGLPCAHNFHVECIVQWLRLNVKCPTRCSVFPDLDLSAFSNLQSLCAEQQFSNTETTMEYRYIRSQPPSQSYLLRLQGLLRPVPLENANPRLETALETAENGGVVQLSPELNRQIRR